MSLRALPPEMRKQDLRLSFKAGRHYSFWKGEEFIAKSDRFGLSGSWRQLYMESTSYLRSENGLEIKQPRKLQEVIELMI